MREIILLPFILNLGLIYSWTVQCDDRGSCTVNLSTQNSTIYLQPGILPKIPEKNIIPLKNSSNSIMPALQVKEKPHGISLRGFLPGSDKYQCADGLGECYQGCCNDGLCSDPSFICSIHENNNNLMMLFTGIIFIIVIIAYWTTYYIFGHIYNQKPLENTADNIYSKFNPQFNLSNKSETNSDKSLPTPLDPLTNNFNPLEKHLSKTIMEGGISKNVELGGDFVLNEYGSNTVLNNRTNIEFNRFEHFNNNFNNLNNNANANNKVEESKKAQWKNLNRLIIILMMI